MKKNELVKISNSLESFRYQLSIGEKILNNNVLSKDQLLFCELAKFFKISLIDIASISHNFNEDILEKNIKTLNWNKLSFNKNWKPSFEFLLKQQDKINFNGISQNTKIEWSEGIIEKFKNKLDWMFLCKNSAIPWSINLIKKFNSYIGHNISWVAFNKNLPINDADFVSEFNAFLKQNHQYYINGYDSSFFGILSHLSIEENIIHSFKNKLNWDKLALNTILNWSEELIEYYKDRWNWHLLSINPNLPWSNQFIEKYEDKWNWELLSNNKGIEWTSELLFKYKEKLSWRILSLNPNLNWTVELVNEFYQYWSWDRLNIGNQGFPWSLDIYKTFNYKFSKDVLMDFRSLQEIDFEYMLNKSEKYLDSRLESVYDCYFDNFKVFPSVELMVNFPERIICKRLNSKPINWDMKFIEKYKALWDWETFFITNKSVPVSVEFLDKFRNEILKAKYKTFIERLFERVYTQITTKEYLEYILKNDKES